MMQGTEPSVGTSDSDMARMSECLRAIAAGLSEQAVARTAFVRLLEMSDLLPLTTGGGFECHLYDPNRVDLAVRVTAMDSERGALADTHAIFSYPGFFYNHPAWQRIRTFAQHWQNTGTLINQRVRYCWLEFDAHLANAMTMPCFFFDSGEKMWRPGGASSDLVDEIAWIYETATILAGRPLDSQVKSQLECCYAHLPPAASFGYIGVMFSRSLSRIRLTLPGFAPPQLVPYLQAIGWRGSLAPAMRLLDLPGARVTLHVDIGQQIGSLLGFEVSFSDSPCNEPGWERLLMACIDAGICQVQALPAILAWPGISDARTWPEQWSPHLSGRGIVRRLNHLKLTYNPEGALSAKAYLYFGLLDHTTNPSESRVPLLTER